MSLLLMLRHIWGGSPPPPPPPTEDLGQFGCGEYEVFVLERGGGTVLANVPWSSLTWERALDDTSTASVRVAGLPDDCCELLGQVRPWRHELAIYRDRSLVWVGPAFAPKAPPDSFEINARDLSAWWDHRLVHRDHYFFQPTDIATIFATLVEDAMEPDNSPGITVSPTATGITATMNLLAVQHYMAGPKLRELAQIGIDWTVIGRSVIVGGESVPATDLGTFVDDHFLVTPTPQMDGSAQANRWIVRGSGGGAAGDSIYGDASDATAASLDGLLESVASLDAVADTETAQAAAETRVALTSAVVLVDQCLLAPEAPVVVDDLVPGALAVLHLTDTCIPVSGTFRLQKVAVSVDASSGEERASLTFQPVGTE